MNHDDPQFKLRLKPELKQQLEAAAKHNTRTLGAEIGARLQTSIDGVSDGLVLDQARQIWELRGQLAMVGINLFSAVNELEKIGFKDKDRLQYLRDSADTTSGHTRYFLSMPDEKVREERVRLGFHPDGENIER